jgi:hypothetical protein
VPVSRWPLIPLLAIGFLGLFLGARTGKAERALSIG